MIETEGLTKRFGYRTALNELTTAVPGGHVRLLVGPNGAGKTTLIRVLATLSRPTSGGVRIAGADLREDSEAVRGLIGVVLHEPLLYPELTVLENLRFYGSLYGVDDEMEWRRALRLVGLLPRAHDRVTTLSAGMAKRLALVRATIHNPRVLLLDEPFADLDLEGRRVLGRFLGDLREEGRTILLATHNVERGWGLADSVTALRKGRAVLEMAVEKDGLPAFLEEYETRVEGA